MKLNNIATGIIQALLAISGVFLLIYFLYLIQSVIAYIAIAAVISLIARPLVRLLKNKLKLPNTVAVVITMGVFIWVLLGVVGLLIPLISKQGENLSLLNFEELQLKVQELFYKLNSYFSNKKINPFEQLSKIDFSSKFREIPNLLNAVVGFIGNFSMGLFSILFISFFLMKDNHLLNNMIMTAVPKGNEGKFKKSFSKIKDLLSRYFIGLVMQISILFILYTILLLIVGIESAIVIAFICALLNLIPYVGPLIGGVIMLTLTMTSNLDLDFQSQILPKATWVLIGYFIAQMIDNFISQPIIFSKSVKSHPLEIFLVIIIGGILFGILGMVVAVPSYTAIKVILKEFLSDNKIVNSLTKDL